METIVAKKFKWEAAHRLSWHEGLCRNLHGHSYHMTVEMTGIPDERGFLIDFQEIKRLLAPLVEQWDHGIFVAHSDSQLLDVVHQTGWKHFVLPFDSTTENVCQYVSEYLLSKHLDTLQKHQIAKISINIAETETCYATVSVVVSDKTQQS
ncbi:MAG: 6-carboxytetrahydropterin synthase [Rhodothermia bacterium]|nr:6-carboxytetrahydropterin synthase [Rhodothermia bacterium]